MPKTKNIFIALCLLVATGLTESLPIPYQPTSTTSLLSKRSSSELTPLLNSLTIPAGDKEVDSNVKGLPVADEDSGVLVDVESPQEVEEGRFLDLECLLCLEEFNATEEEIKENPELVVCDHEGTECPVVLHQEYEYSLLTHLVVLKDTLL